MNVETEKISIALEYIETASILWIHDINYYSVMHLAAAAEEISGKACRIERKKSNYDELREKVIRMLSAVRVDHTENDIKNAFYGAKNSIKHLDNESDRLVNLNSKNESATYIVSAFRNFEKLGLSDVMPSSVKRVVELNTLHVTI
jgi:hypothetical protein